MTLFRRVFKYKKENPLAYRVLFYVLLFSSFITLLTTGIQLYTNYSKDVQLIEKRLHQIQAGYGQGLAVGAWDLEISQIYKLLNGIIQLPDIQYLLITGLADETLASVGTFKEQNIISHHSNLILIDANGTKHEVGHLQIIASLDGVDQRLRETVFQILVFQMIKTFLVSIFILLVIRHFITRHLSAIAQFTSQKNLRVLDSSLKLNRKQNTVSDELEHVVIAINRARTEILQYFTEIAKRETELKRVKNYVQSIINSMHSVLVGSNADGKVTHWNSEAHRITGLKASKAIGEGIEKVLPQSNVNHNEIRNAIAESTLLEKNNVKINREGQSTFYDVTIYPLSGNNIKEVVIRMDDVTERVRFEELMVHQEKMISVGLLAAGVAHEINNPINGVINYAQILKNDFPEKSMVHDIGTRIVKEGNRIANIVGSLLTFARHRHEKKTTIAVSRILSETLSLINVQLEKDSIHLQIDDPSNWPKITCHHHQIQQVFLNIISNSQYALNSKYPIQHKNKTLQISCKKMSKDENKMFQIVFLDKGVGIAEEALNSITDPFFSTKPIGEGTGLGLSISEGIVKDHGGSLLTESIFGEYTKVTIELPFGENRNES
ncbi:MAG: PAS domain S-box protein [Deltaproteobacteria bacterium]|nr:PAS domain S-box protein [Deltaproteobacteria bacterium]